uniref:Uncharacterized protein n=1 Tax=Phasianus colchicus TaxID=9054 RepID=A0A669QZF9_PHACC
LSETYGPVFTVQLGMRKVVVLSGYDTVKEALVNHADAFAGRPKIPILEKTGKGKGLIFARGEHWKVMRRFTLTTLRDFGMGKKAIEDHVVEEYGYLTLIEEKSRRQLQDRKPLEMTQLMNSAIANVIVSILIGKRFDYEDPTFKRLVSLMDENMKLFGSPSVSVIDIVIIVLPKAFPQIFLLLYTFNPSLTFVYEFFSLFSKMKKFVLEYLTGIIALFFQENGKGNTFFDNENLIEVVRNLFIAGMDTTATTLRWGLLLMMKYPEIQSKWKLGIQWLSSHQLALP